MAISSDTGRTENLLECRFENRWQCFDLVLAFLDEIRAKAALRSNVPARCRHDRHDVSGCESLRA